MPCPPRDPAATRRLIADLFARGETEAAFAHRLNQCCHASPCGRLCRRLVKAPGLQAWCVDLATGQRTDVYSALADPCFRCPDGNF